MSVTRIAIRNTALFVGLALAGAVTAADRTAHINPELAAALQRDLGISAQQLPEYLNAEAKAIAQEYQARQQLGADYAGSWMKRGADGSYRFVVATVGSAKNAGAIGAEVRQVVFSLAQLDNGVALLNSAITAMRDSPALARVVDGGRLDGIHAWYVDVETNAIVIKAAPKADKAAIDFVAASGVDSAMVRIEESEGEPMNAVNIYGGRRYSTGGGSCSIGFAVTRGSTKGFATAGHCGTSGTSVGVGGVTVGSVQGRSFPTNDMAWANVRSVDTLLGLVDRYNGSGSDVSVLGSSEAATGASVCRSGYASGYRCGTITSKNVTVNYSAGAVFQLTQSSACLTQGDSGGSWITPGGQAQGVSSGGQLGGSAPPFSNCQFTNPVSYFQKINEILSTYGLTLVR